MGKAKVTQDFLYEYLTSHNVNMNRLSEMMCVSNGSMMGCFHHDLNRHGKPMSLSSSNIRKMNEVLVTMADHIRQGVVTFGSDQTYTSRRGETYDPATVPQLNALQRWFKLEAFFQRVVGWSKSRSSSTLRSPAARAYGTVTADQVSRINAELLAVAGMLGGIEVEIPEKVK